MHFDPTHGELVRDTLRGDLMDDNERKDAQHLLWRQTHPVRVQAPAYIRNGDNRSVIAYNVDTNLTESQLLDNLLPPPVSVRRFKNKEGSTRTIKITYSSQGMAEAVCKRKAVLFDGCVYLTVKRVRRRRNKGFCTTCKRLIGKCPNGPTCKDIRCAKCGEKHRTNDCITDNVKCIQCSSSGHMLYDCPQAKQESERLKQIKAKAVQMNKVDASKKQQKQK